MADSTSPAQDHAIESMKQGFPAARFVQELGLELVDLGPGWCETELKVTERHGQAQGQVHAGVMATMADHTAGAGASVLVLPESIMVTVEFKINLLRPASGRRLTCRADVIKPGRRIAVCEARVLVHNGEAARLCATASLSMMPVAIPQAPS